MSDEATTIIDQQPETPAQAQPPESAPDKGAANERMFSQAELDAIIKDRLDRERGKAEKAAEAAKAEAARKAAEEQGKFKELYEAAQARLAEAEQLAKASELARLRAEVAHKLELPAPLADRLRGETADELEADAKVLLAAIPKPASPTATDAAAGLNGRQPTPQKTDAEIAEMAARYGVSFEALKQQFIKEQ